MKLRVELTDSPLGTVAIQIKVHNYPPRNNELTSGFLTTNIGEMIYNTEYNVGLWSQG
jgi:hypothetical protein